MIEGLGKDLRWALRALRRTLRKRQSYVILTPPHWRTQWVYGKGARRLRRYETHAPSDHRVLRQVFEDEDYRLGDARGAEIDALYRCCVATGRTPLIIDCGANIGASAAYFAEVFPAARIVALEPDPGNIALARRNCPAAQVEFLLAGIAAEDGRAMLVDPGIGAWGYRTERDPAGDIAMVSVPSLLARYPEAVPLLIKIDIEGFERELFASNTGWVARFPLLIIELHDWLLPRSGSSAPFLRTIAALERDFIHRGENVFSYAHEIAAPPDTAARRETPSR